MNQFLNQFHRNHNVYYKIFLFVLTTFLIVYLFPKSGTFRYSFEKGKPWQSENLYAPFDFAIQKSIEELQAEKTLISSESNVFFEQDTLVVNRITSNLKPAFDQTFFEIPRGPLKTQLYNRCIYICLLYTS